MLALLVVLFSVVLFFCRVLVRGGAVECFLVKISGDHGEVSTVLHQLEPSRWHFALLLLLGHFVDARWSS